MAFPVEYVPLLASISAALIAGTVAFVVAVLSKELKTSEFRQSWIDCLRTDIAEMVATAQMTAHAVTARRAYGEQKHQIVQFLYEKHPDFISIQSRRNRILLRLNPTEHARLIGAVSTLADFSPLDAEDDAIAASVEQLLAECQPVLKAEWERVKRGEPIFIWTKRVALGAIAVGLVTGTAVLAWLLVHRSP
jgi:hypothetical protein